MLIFNPSKRVLVFLFTLLLFGCGEQHGPERMGEGPVHVDTLTMSKVRLRLSTELPGRISAFKEAEVRPQVSGIIKSRLFQEGADVKAGQVLYQIDPMSYQASVNSNKAELAKAKADQEATQKTVRRYRELLNKKQISQQDYDDAYSADQQALAEVAIRQAELDNANILLSYTQIKAPISGKIGISQVSEGALVTAQQSSYLATIIQSDQVYVDMTQSSVVLYARKKEFNLSGNSDKPSIPVKISLEDGSEYEQTGYFSFSDAKVDDSTGSVTLRALIANKNHTLLPGMFVRAHIAAPEAKEYIVLPQSAVVRSQSGAPSAYIVNAENIIEKRTLILGDEVDNGWVVTEGLNVGDRVVISNLSKVKQDLNVVVDNKNSVSKKQTPPVTKN